MSSTAVATGVVGLTLVVSGCGTDRAEGDSAASTGDVVAEAAQRTLDAGTARISFTTERTQSAAEGHVDFDRHLVELGDDRPNLIIDGSTFYDTNDSLPEGTWRKYDIADNEPAALLLRSPDAVHLLEVLVESSDVAAPFADVGEENVRGAPATRYLGGVEEEALADALVPGIPYASFLESERIPSGLTSLGVWIDAEGLVRRVEYQLSILGPLGGEKTTIELFDFGAPVDIEIPGPENVVEVGG